MLVRRPDAGACVLSFGQERLWFLDQLEPGSAAYNLTSALRLTGTLAITPLAQSFGEIVRRHEALRTTFALVRGEPVQEIAPPEPPPLPVVDLRSLPGVRRGREAERLVGEGARRPFDLSRGPLLRTALLALDATEHILLVTMHHIVSDGWSIGIFVRELGALYAAFVAGRPSPFSALTIQYADFSYWQRQWLVGEALNAELAYWRERLAGLPPVLELHVDRPRPAVRTARGAKRALPLPPDLAPSLLALGPAHGATLFMVLLTAYQALLLRYSGQDDIAVGTPVAGRKHLETESLIGLFINTLVLRTDLAGDPTFTELLLRVKEVTLGAFAHADVPFEKLVETLQPERNLSHTPLFQAMFQLQNAPQGRLELPGLVLSPLASDTGTARFDLTLTCLEADGGIFGSFGFDRDLFDAPTIERLARHFASLLAALAAGSERRLSELPLLAPAERHQLLREWSDTAEATPGGPCIHRWIEAQARRTPEAPALVAGERCWSYRELDGAANRLARHLRGQGLGLEGLVAICVERSAEMVLAVLAVMKAGGAYLPLDPSHPRERLASILEDAGRPLLLTQEHLLADLPQGRGRAVCLDGDRGLIERQSDAALETGDEEAEALAYVIYTSGSTGKPKGVQVPRRGLANFLGTMRSRSMLTARDVLVAVTTLAFDIAGLELLLPLVVGARLVVASREAAGDGMRLAGLLAASGATALQATPATWRQLVEAGWAPPCGFHVLCGGEALPGELAAHLLQEGSRLWNLYGPTETTIWSAVERVGAAAPAVVPIGRPLGNTGIHLLDRRGQPVPAGVPGEVCIGGAGVARGYLRRPALTAERFAPDPFTDVPGSRLYRTGDLARRLPDGRIEFLGRLDHQVKIRGFRIELGEIEGALLQHPAVRQAVVAVRDGLGGDRRLVAYAVAAGEALTISELRRFLHHKLPDYMLPSALVLLERLPLNPSGKVDRRALPALSADRPALGAVYEPPRSDLEAAVAEIWRELLQVDRVGIHDNFFDLGGHSLLLVRVRGRLQERCGAAVSVLDMFEHPTVSSLARRLAEPGDGRRPELAVGAERVPQLSRGKQRIQQRLAQRRGAVEEVLREV
jgi:amino acid adenylation domain-containing protein